MKSKMSAHEFEIMYDKYKKSLYKIAFTYLKELSLHRKNRYSIFSEER